MKSILLSVAVIGLATAAGLPLMSHHRAGRGVMPQSDTLTSGVRSYPGDKEQVLKGATHDLSLLDVHTFSITPNQQLTPPSLPDSSDDLLIVKEGNLTVSSYDSISGLGPGGIALFNAGAIYSLRATGTAKAIFYLFRFRSRQQYNPAFTGSGHYPFLLDWAAIPVQHTPKGESRQIVSQPTPWLTKIDMHATTLNPGEVSHLPHIHRSEEIILMRSGHVQMYINGQHYPAAGGDLVFLASGNPHALENKSAERCEYFALQWQQ